MPKTYLLSRTLDPLLGVFTGFLAYYLHETNPRTAPPPGHTLRDLLVWQWEANAEKRRAHAVATQITDAFEMEVVRRELEAEDKALQVATTAAAGAAAAVDQVASGTPAAGAAAAAAAAAAATTTAKTTTTTDRVV